MTHHHFLLGSAAIIGALAFAAWALQPRPSAINQWNASRIEKGMTLAQAEAILGGPPRQEGERYPCCLFGPRPAAEWGTPSLVVRVSLDHDGHVRSVDQYHDDGPLEFVRQWLGL